MCHGQTTEAHLRKWNFQSLQAARVYQRFDKPNGKLQKKYQLTSHESSNHQKTSEVQLITQPEVTNMKYRLKRKILKQCQ